jgi:hypothetical protein
VLVPNSASSQLSSVIKIYSLHHVTNMITMDCPIISLLHYYLRKQVAWLGNSLIYIFKPFEPLFSLLSVQGKIIICLNNLGIDCISTTSLVAELNEIVSVKCTHLVLHGTRHVSGGCHICY